MKVSPYFLETVDDFDIQVLPLIDDPYFYTLMATDTWPHPEIDFLRKLAHPKLRMLDLDYGIGFHSLLMARLCGAQAGVFSIFLHQEYAPLARASIDKNSFAQIEALNIDRAGEIHTGYPAAYLDSYLSGHFKMLDLVRIAQPALPDLIRYSAKFLAAQSPLLMVEIEDSEEVAKLTSYLQSHHYHLFHYIPGLGALTPTTPDEIDDFTAAVFYCKPDRLEKLILRELAFVPQATNRPAAPPKILLSHFSDAIARTTFETWQEAASLPVSAGDAAYWTAAAGALMGMNFPLPLSIRFAYLQEAYEYFRPFMTDLAALEKNICFFTIALSLGKRREAFICLEKLVFETSDHNPVPALPFLLDPAIAGTIEASTAEAWLRSYLLECFDNCRLTPGEPDSAKAQMSLIMAAEQKRVSTITLAMDKRRIMAAAWLGLPHAALASRVFEKNWLNIPAWRDMAADNGRIYYHHSVTEKDASATLADRSKDRMKTAFALCIVNGISFSTYMDIGCAEGTSAISYYRSGIFRNLKIVNVDPNELYATGLTQIASVTGGVYLQCAVSDYDGEAQFQESGHEYWASLLPSDSPYWNDYRANEVTTRTVPVKTIATIVEEHGLKGPMILKMDVQGVETAVLNGMRAVKDEVALVIVETFAIDMTSIHNTLDSMGFTLFDITSQQYYQKGILGWFYPVYLNKRYLPLFANKVAEVPQSLLDLQHERREASDAWVKQCMKDLELEKILSAT